MDELTNSMFVCSCDAGSSDRHNFTNKHNFTTFGREGSLVTGLYIDKSLCLQI